MASIERTAYPRFKRNPTSKELHEVYTPTSEEMQFAHSVARGSAPVMSLLVMMKRSYAPSHGSTMIWICRSSAVFGASISKNAHKRIRHTSYRICTVC